MAWSASPCAPSANPSRQREPLGSMLLTSALRDHDAQATGRFRKRFDDGLWTIEVPILRANARADDSRDLELRDKLTELFSGGDARRDAYCVLRCDVLAKPFEALRLVSNEDVAAGTEPRIHARAQPLLELRVERKGVARHQAVEPSAPLLTHAARLHSGGSGADPVPFVNHDAPDVVFREVERNGEACDAGADDCDVAGQRKRTVWAFPTRAAGRLPHDTPRVVAGSPVLLPRG